MRINELCTLQQVEGLLPGNRKELRMVGRETKEPIKLYYVKPFNWERMLGLRGLPVWFCS